MRADEFVHEILAHPKGGIEKLIELAGGGETDWLEFKDALEPRDGKYRPCKDRRKNEKKPDYQWNLAKAVISMANTRGGAVLVGVRETDSGFPEPAGLYPDRKNWDDFCREVVKPALFPENGWLTGCHGRWKTDDSWEDGIIKYEKTEWEGKTIGVLIVKPVENDNLIFVEDLENQRTVLLKRAIGKVGQVVVEHDPRKIEGYRESRDLGKEDFKRLWRRFLFEAEPSRPVELNEDHFGMKVRGVNLGGWLALEKWMTPSLFGNTDAEDELSLCLELGKTTARQKLRKHREEFVTREDFKWLAAHGINAVRIPVGHWIFGPPYPYHKRYGSEEAPYVEGGIEILDRAFDWADLFGLCIQLDLHAAPGCQNGYDNGGIKGVCDWHTKPEYRQHSIDVLGRLARRYHNHRTLHSIHVLNSPGAGIPTRYLMDYIRDAYHEIRKHCLAKHVAVVFSDAFRDPFEFRRFLPPPEYENVVLDVHRYQCFDPKFEKMNIFQHIREVAGTRKAEADKLATELGLWTFAGQWSLALPEDALADGDPLFVDAARRALGAAQLLVYDKLHRGWYFHTYKTEDRPEWSFRECVERCWLPSDYRFGEE